MKKEEILIVTPLNLPVPATQGGAIESLIENLIKINEEKKSVNFTILSIFDETAFKNASKYSYTSFIWIKKNSIIKSLDKLLNLIFLKIIKRHGNGNYLQKLSFNKKIKKILLQNNFDKIILENNGFLTNIYTNKIQKKYANKIYYHLHNIIPNNINKKLLLNEKIISVSKFVIEDGKTRLGERFFKNTYILKNCINTSSEILKKFERKKFRKELDFNENDIVIIFVGRIAPEKGILELLSAIDNVESKNLKLLLIGAPEFKNKAKSEYYEKVCQKIKTMKHTVKKLGFIDNKNLWKYYQISDFAIFPCASNEAAGLTIIEALLNGLTVITTDSGGIPEYFDLNYGTMVTYNDDIISSLTENIKRIIKSEKYGTFNTDARNYVLSNFNEKKYYDEFIKIINDKNGRKNLL